MLVAHSRARIVGIISVRFVSRLFDIPDSGAVLTLVAALTGPDAISPPSESANASSNCHPTLPKSNTLSKGFVYNQTGTYYAASTVSMISGIDLVLTAFWSPEDEVEGVLEEPDANAECLWPVALNKGDLSNMSTGGATKSTRWSSAGVVAVAAVLFAGMLL